MVRSWSARACDSCVYSRVMTMRVSGLLGYGMRDGIVCEVVILVLKKVVVGRYGVKMLLSGLVFAESYGWGLVLAELSMRLRCWDRIAACLLMTSVSLLSC
jgi:hypothetical protein